MDLLRVNADQDGREARRDLANQLSERSVALPTGRQYPVVYADAPWHRKQGVTSRSYENHYPTVSWSEICALPVKDLPLPDAWLFLWIPRAHAFALHEIETEVTLPATGEVVTAKVEMPLAWAVAKSWGCDAYSTAFVWTKTDEDHPDEAGGAVLARDQDELLLMFKRGRGLPKPDTGEKFGSNHRERSRPPGHSTKPLHYRRMIATMAGRGVPVLELFARFDADSPPPPCWDFWGNQATVSGANSEIADGIERSTADQPAPPAAKCLPVDGEVDSAASDSRAATAVPPADRPGSNSQAHPLDIPEFLRRPLQAEMDLTRRDRTPAVIVDDALQTRLPLTEDELVLQAALTSIAAGQMVDSWILRDLVGAGFVHIGTSSVTVTDEGQAFLAQLVAPAPAAAIEARA